jgi:hypothetical protein
MSLSAAGVLLIQSDLSLSTGSITSASGAISFGNENLSTTGSITAGSILAPHDTLFGLLDDDHTQYLLLDGDRADSLQTIDGDIAADSLALNPTGTASPLSSFTFALGNDPQWVVRNEGGTGSTLKWDGVTWSLGNKIIVSGDITLSATSDLLFTNVGGNIGNGTDSNPTNGWFDGTLSVTGDITALADINLSNDKYINFGSAHSIGYRLAGTVLDINGSFNINTTLTDGSEGVIYQNDVRFLHTFGTSNIFIGPSSGNLAGTLTGSGNVCLGDSSGNALTTGSNNFYLGFQTGKLNAAGGQNVCIGGNNTLATTNRSNLVGIGYGCFAVMTTGQQNVAVGTNAIRYGTVARNSVAIGYECLRSLGTGGSAGSNSNLVVGIGDKAGYSLTTGKSNIFLGASSGYWQTTGSDLLIVDNQARGGSGAPTDNISSILYGVMNTTVASQTLTINADTTIGNATTAQPLQVTGVTTLTGLTYPSADGSSGDVMTTDGAGTLTLKDPTIMPNQQGQAKQTGMVASCHCPPHRQ